MANRTNNQAGPVQLSALELEKIRIEQGALGRFFGVSAHMVHYIAILCLLLASALMIIFVIEGVAAQHAAFATSLVTLAGGLLGGRAARN